MLPLPPGPQQDLFLQKKFAERMSSQSAATSSRKETHNVSRIHNITQKQRTARLQVGGKGRCLPTRRSAAFRACPGVTAGSGKTRRLMRVSLVRVLVTASKPCSVGSMEHLASRSCVPCVSPAEEFKPEESKLPCCSSVGCKEQLASQSPCAPGAGPPEESKPPCCSNVCPTGPAAAAVV